jgi:hypothetical protein
MLSRLTNDIVELSFLHRVFEWTLNANITNLPDPGASTWDVSYRNSYPSYCHVITKVETAMNEPDIDMKNTDRLQNH